MAKTYYYILVNKNGNPINTDHKLPIYWNYEIAFDDARRFKAYIKKIRISELKLCYERKD